MLAYEMSLMVNKLQEARNIVDHIQNKIDAATNLSEKLRKDLDEDLSSG